jgi:hypothetical protein
MSRPEVRAKVSTKLRAMGWKPPVQGGNGRPIPIAQQALAAALGWPCEVAIPTGVPRDGRFPTCYKIDIASEALKVGIEVDGGSHGTLERRALDAKRDQFMASIGWTMLRFSNEDVTTNLSGCVQKVLSTISK